METGVFKVPMRMSSMTLPQKHIPQTINLNIVLAAPILMRQTCIIM